MVADNPNYPPRLRAKAVAVLGLNPQPEDGERFAEFLASDAPKRIKLDALTRASSWQVANIRPAVRHVLQNEEDYHLIKAAVEALTLCCVRSKAEVALTPEMEEDIRLIEAAAAREDAPEWFIKSCPRNIQILRGYRGPLIGDKWPWERLPKRGE
jgi:hypothetical protein